VLDPFVHVPFNALSIGLGINAMAAIVEELQYQKDEKEEHCGY